MNMPTARIPMSNVQKAAHAGADMNMPTSRIPMSNVQKAANPGAETNMPTARIPMHARSWMCGCLDITRRNLCCWHVRVRSLFIGRNINNRCILLK
jgi:hypothetical protein